MYYSLRYSSVVLCKKLSSWCILVRSRVCVAMSLVLIQVELAFLTWLASLSCKSETQWHWVFSVLHNIRIVLDLVIHVLEE